MRKKHVTSREVTGVIAAMLDSPGRRLVADYIDRLHAALDETDMEDMLGTEGWRKYLLKEDF